MVLKYQGWLVKVEAFEVVTPQHVGDEGALVLEVTTRDWSGDKVIGSVDAVAALN
jgi:hypothetical protein